MIAAVHAAYGLQAARCPKCREPALRERWGCDKPAAAPVYQSSCHACFGTTLDCETCGGHGKLMFDRCPSARASRFAREVVSLLGMVKDKGVLPAAGGYGDQPARLMSLIEVAWMEANRLEEAQRENDKERTRRAPGR